MNNQGMYCNEQCDRDDGRCIKIELSILNENEGTSKLELSILNENERTS